MGLLNWRTILRGLLMGLGAWFLTMPPPLQEIGAAMMAIAAAIGSSASSVVAGAKETVKVVTKEGSK